MEINFCQNKTKDGLQECGFLVGSKCKANPEKEFWLSPQVIRVLEVVGCQSYQRYLNYDERRERFGNESVTHCNERGIEGRETRPESGISPMSELPKPEVGRGRECDRREQDIPMRELQAGSDSQGNPQEQRPTGGYLKCKFCDGEATVTDCHIHYCKKCAEKMGL